MKTLDFKKKIVDLNGNDVVENDKVLTVGSCIVNILSIGTATQPVNIPIQYDLSLRIHKATKVFDLEDAEYNIIKELASKNEAKYVNLVLAQIVKAVSDAKTKKGK